MAIFDTFYLLFEADTSKVEKGLKTSDKAARDIEKTLIQTDKVADSLGNSFVTMAKSFGALVVGTIAASAIKAVTIATAEQNVELDRQAQNLRLNIETMQQWQGAFEAAGSSANTFNTFFQKIGEKTKEPIKYIENLSDRLKGMNQDARQNLGKQLGLDSGAIALLSQGRRGVQELLEKQKELGIVTQQDADKAKLFAEQQRLAGRALNDVKNQIGTAMLPALTWLLQKFTDIVRFLQKHKTFVYAFFVGAAAAITTFFLPAVIKATAATWGLIRPWVLMGGAIVLVGAAIALVIDDIYHFLKGNNSVIGELAKKWPIVGDVIRGLATAIGHVIDALGGLWDTVKTVVGGIVDIFKNPQKAIDAVSENVKSLTDQFPVLKAVVDGVAAAFQAFGVVAKAAISGILWVVEKLANVIGWVAGKISSFSGTQMAHLGESDPAAGRIAEDIAAGKGVMSQTNTPLAAQTSSSIQNRNLTSNRTTTVQTGDINIQTNATDTDGISNAIGQSLRDEMNSAVNQFDDGQLA